MTSIIIDCFSTHNIKNNNMLMTYIEHINSNRQNKEKYKTAKHHILPKCLFPEFNNKIKYPWNFADLSHKNHFIAHYYLYMSICHYKITSAFIAMSNKDSKNGRISESDVEEYAEAYSEAKIEFSKYLSNKRSGSKLSDEAKVKISKANKGRIKSLSEIQKLSKVNKGKKAVLNVLTNKTELLDISSEEYISGLKNGKYKQLNSGIKRSKEYSENLSKIHKNKVMVEINGIVKKIDKNDSRIISGKLQIFSPTKGKSILSNEEKELRRLRWIENNPNSITINIYNVDNKLVYENIKNLSKCINENNLPRALLNTYKNISKLGSTPNTKSRLINEGFSAFIGWYARKV